MALHRVNTMEISNHLNHLVLIPDLTPEPVIDHLPAHSDLLNHFSEIQNVIFEHISISEKSYNKEVPFAL